jgi:hypothetical protein
MSGLQADGSFDLTHSKAMFYLRRPLSSVPAGIDPVDHFLTAAGLEFVKTKWGGWNVEATQGQIWTALSGEAAKPSHYRG